jgi:hypothetical protein
MIRLLRLAVVAVATLLVAAGTGHSADKRPYSLRYALILEGADPVAGEANCFSDTLCDFPSTSIRDLKFKFKRSTGELEVNCFDCSLASGRVKAWCGDCRANGIFEGRDYGFETLLVIRKRPLVGTLLLRY